MKSLPRVEAELGLVADEQLAEKKKNQVKHDIMMSKVFSNFGQT